MKARAVMTMPLAILAFFAIALGRDRNAGVAVVPGHSSTATAVHSNLAALWRAGTDDADGDLVGWWCLLGLGLGWWLYGNSRSQPEEPDALEKALPPVLGCAARQFYVDEFYGSDGDRVLRVVGAGCGLAGPPHMGWRW